MYSTYNRRSFLKASALAGGGMLLSFNWFMGCTPSTVEEELALPDEWYKINGYLKIGDNGVVTIMSPNPEGGQNIKTSMPMIVAEELDVDWDKVIVEQAPLDTSSFTRQFIGGSQAIRLGWDSLRTAGATARAMLITAAAQTWEVDEKEITTKEGYLYHENSGKKAHYGEVASLAATMEIPENVDLKKLDEYTIIGTSRKNVDGRKIVTGKPMYGIDTYQEGMLYAMIIHPPAFGMKLKSFDASSAMSMPGIKDVFAINVFNEGYEKQFFDTNTFNDKVAIVGNSTWEVMQAKKAIKAEFEPIQSYTEVWNRFGNKSDKHIPGGLESTSSQYEKMNAASSSAAKVVRKDGNPEKAFAQASKLIERTYTAPFLAHNCMEPMNFFADIKENKAYLSGPLQKPELTEQALSARLGMPIEDIEIHMTRLGGAYGRRSYAHWAVEAAVISQKMDAPVKLIYSREDDMSAGIYRPLYHAVYRAALDENNNLVAFHVNAGGIPESPLYADRFPAGAVDNYLAEEWTIDSNLTVGSFRAPRSNFIAAAEQSFLDEIAEVAGKDPIDFRLELLEKAKNSPVGERNDYDPERFAGVLKLLRKKSNWDSSKESNARGVSAYFCHNSYAAQVIDIAIENGGVKVKNVCCAVDCGIVVNPDAATNLCEGAIVDALGNAFYGNHTFREGEPDKRNFDKYRMIRMREAPENIEVYFVENGIAPTGLGEPAFPPVFGALANALYQASGKRQYDQPYNSSVEKTIVG